MRISDWSSDVCSSDLALRLVFELIRQHATADRQCRERDQDADDEDDHHDLDQREATLKARDQDWRRAIDRKSVVSGTSVEVRVDLGGRRVLKKKMNKNERVSA